MKKTEKLSHKDNQKNLDSSLEPSQLNVVQRADKPSVSAELEIIRNSLLHQKSEILNRNSEFKSTQSKGDKFSDEADQTAQELENTLSIQLHERERHALLLIEKTLSKFTDGTYGECESCSDSIGFKRLQARPMATLCISCMEDLEQARSLTPYQ